MNKMRTLVATAVLLSLAFVGYAQRSRTVDEYVVFQVEDTSPALRLKNGSTNGDKVQFNFDAGDSATNTVTIGSTATTLDFSSAGADTITEIAEDIEAATNSAGKKVLTVDYNCSLAADSSDDELLDTKQTVIRAGEWGTICLWDTSNAKFFSCYIPGQDGKGATVGKKVLKKIYGNIGGTGSITVNIYEDGTEKFEQVILCPTYDWSAAGTTETWAADEVGPAQLSAMDPFKAINFPLKAGKDYMIRATRASTGTTGSIGAVVQQL